MTQQHHPSIAFAREASLGLPGSIKQVADFLLAEGTGISSLTMGQIAARAYTSKPTLVRFAKLAGYAGWKDYRRDFLEAMGQVEAERARCVEVDVNAPFGQDASMDEVVASLARIHRLAVAEVEASLDRKALKSAAEALLSARTVAHLGVMQNYWRGKVFASNLSLMGVLCLTPQGQDEAGPIVRMLEHEDCVVVSSYSGGLAHVPVSFVPQLRERGVTVVAITNSEHSPLGEVADHTLAYRPLEHYHAKVGSFYSGACTQLILDALFAACYARRFDESRLSRRSVLESIGANAPLDFGRIDE